MTRRKWLLIDAAAVVAAVGFLTAYYISSPSHNKAVAVSPSVFLSPTGADTNPCTQQAPCRTFARAYHLALPGQVVELAAGDYGSQALPVSSDANKVDSTNPVVFRPASGAVVTMGELSIRSYLNGSCCAPTPVPVSGLEFQDITMSDFVIAFARNITFRNVISGADFIRGGQNISYLGGEICCNSTANSPVVGSFAGQPISRSILFDGVHFHDMTSVNAPGGHDECLFIQDADGVTVKNSHFGPGCYFFDVYGNPQFGSTTLPTNVVFDHNQFDVSAGGGFYSFHANMGSYTLTNNTFGQGIAVDAPVTLTGCGNVSAGSSMAANYPALIVPCQTTTTGATTTAATPTAATTTTSPPATVTVTGPTVTETQTVTETVTAQVPGDQGCTPNCDQVVSDLAARLNALIAEVQAAVTNAGG